MYIFKYIYIYIWYIYIICMFNQTVSQRQWTDNSIVLLLRLFQHPLVRPTRVLSESFGRIDRPFARKIRKRRSEPARAFAWIAIARRCVDTRWRWPLTTSNFIETEWMAQLDFHPVSSIKEFTADETVSFYSRRPELLGKITYNEERMRDAVSKYMWAQISEFWINMGVRKNFFRGGNILAANILIHGTRTYECADRKNGTA